MKKEQRHSWRSTLLPGDLRGIVRGVGVGLLILPAVAILGMLYPALGYGSGQSYELGGDLARLLLRHAGAVFDGVAGMSALIVMGVGLVVLVASLFVPD